jgi:hypothetical protein
VHEGGGVERLAGLLPGELSGRQPAQFRVHEWQQIVGRAGVAAGEGVQDPSDVGHGTLSITVIRLADQSQHLACVGPAYGPRNQSPSALKLMSLRGPLMLVEGAGQPLTKIPTVRNAAPSDGRQAKVLVARKQIQYPWPFVFGLRIVGLKYT